MDLNRRRSNPQQDIVLAEILTLVMKYPLEEDRGKCRENIERVLEQRMSMRCNDDNSED